MAKDALKAHARDELGIVDATQARPIQAVFASAASFAVVAILPLAVVLISPPGALVGSVILLTTILLAVLGAIGATIGGASVVRASALPRSNWNIVVVPMVRHGLDSGEQIWKLSGTRHANTGMVYNRGPGGPETMITQPAKPKRLPLKPLPISGRLTRCEPRENNLRLRAQNVMQSLSEPKREVIERAVGELRLRLAERNLDAALSSVRLAHAAIEAMHSSSIDPSEPIGTLGIRTEVQHRLEAHGFLTLRSLAGARDDELLAIRGLTPAMLTAIRQRLRELRISKRR